MYMNAARRRNLRAEMDRINLMIAHRIGADLAAKGFKRGNVAASLVAFPMWEIGARETGTDAMLSATMRGFDEMESELYDEFNASLGSHIDPSDCYPSLDAASKAVVK